MFRTFVFLCCSRGQQSVFTIQSIDVIKSERKHKKWSNQGNKLIRQSLSKHTLASAAWQAWVLQLVSIVSRGRAAIFEIEYSSKLIKLYVRQGFFFFPLHLHSNGSKNLIKKQINHTTWGTLTNCSPQPQPWARSSCICGFPATDQIVLSQGKTESTLHLQFGKNFH